MMWLVLAVCAGTIQPVPPDPARAQDGSRNTAITVSAAISLTEALEKIAAAYARSGGGIVRFNFAGSNVLARQIVNGAPVDVFVSADAEQMDLVQKAGAIDEATRVDLVGNRLAVVAP